MLGAIAKGTLMWCRVLLRAPRHRSSAATATAGASSPAALRLLRAILPKLLYCTAVGRAEPSKVASVAILVGFAPPKPASDVGEEEGSPQSVLNACIAAEAYHKV